MKENMLSLLEFVNEEGFELNRYLTSLFDSLHLPGPPHNETEPAQ